jgi:hypothetical protein
MAARGAGLRGQARRRDRHRVFRDPVDPDPRRARNSLQINAFGSNMPRSSIPARELTPEERRAALEARWEYGGLFFLGAFGDLLLDKAANDEAAAKGYEGFLLARAAPPGLSAPRSSDR